MLTTVRAQGPGPVDRGPGPGTSVYFADIGDRGGGEGKKGTLAVGEIGGTSIFQAETSGGRIIIRADDIIINGDLVAQSASTTIEIQASNRIWIRKGVTLRSTATGNGDSIRFMIQADGAMYIDEGVSLEASAVGFCTCLFENASPRYGNCGGQCVPLERLVAPQ